MKILFKSTGKVTLPFFILFSLLMSSFYSNAQTSLSYGDVVIVGWNNNITTSGNRDYQWVPLVNLAPGAVIKFSAAGFHSTANTNATNNARPTAGITIWTNTTGATINAGTVITNDQGGGTTIGSCSMLPITCSCGVSSAAYMVQSTSGGRFFVYDGGTGSSTATDFASNSNPTTFNGRAITMFAFQGIQTSTTWLTSGTTGNFLTYMPADLASYSIYLASNAIGGYYNGPRINGSAAAIRAAVLNPSNWTTVSGAGSTVTYPTGNFVLGSSFAFSGSRSFSVNQHSGTNTINANLAIVDTSYGRNDTLSVIHAPVHGTLGGFPHTITSSGSFVTPSGLSYTPATGYTGMDSFTIRLSNGVSSVSAVFRVNVMPFAPTTLSYGDILLTGVNNNLAPVTRSYQWVPFRDLGPGTVVKFTNAGFNSNANANVANNAVTSSRTTTVWTNTTGTTIPAGTVITNDALGNTTIGSCSNIPTACGCGSTGSLMTQSTSGGWIFVYHGTTANSTSTDFASMSGSTTFNGTPISILGLQGTQTWTNWLTSGTTSAFMTWLPADLNAHSLFLGTSAVGGTYTGPRTGGSAAAYKAAILNPTNWTTVRDTATVSYSYSNFNIIVPGHPPTFVSGATQNLTFCDNAGTRSLTSMLKVNDADTGNTITYSLLSAPSHGTASVAYTTTSTGTVITPSGLTYAPVSGFTGRDTFSVKVSDGTDSAVTTIRVLVNPSPALPVISGATYVCNAATTTLTGTPSGGLWGSMDGRASVVGSTGVVRGLIGGTATIYYNSPYNSYSCRSQSTYSLSVITAPSAGTLSGPSGLCPSSSITITPTVSGGAWSVSYPGIASVSAGVVTGVAPGGATISYTVSNVCFSSRVTKAITVAGTPVTPGVISGVPYVCEGGATISMTNALAGGVWSMSNTSLATVSTGGVITSIAAGIDTVIYAYTNSCGITRSVFKPVTIRPLPNAGSISGVSTIIRGNNALLTASVSGGTWSSSNTSLATINTSGRMYAIAVGTDTIRYSVTNSCGTATAIRSIAITASRADNTINGEQTGESQITLAVYPNPTTGIATVELQGGEGIMQVLVTDIAGKLMLSAERENPKATVDLSGLSSGTYLLKITNSGRQYNEKIIVQ